MWTWCGWSWSLLMTISAQSPSGRCTAYAVTNMFPSLSFTSLVALKSLCLAPRNTTNDKQRGQIVPYADPRASTDRLNALFSPQGWTHDYKVKTVTSPG